MLSPMPWPAGEWHASLVIEDEPDLELLVLQASEIASWSWGRTGKVRRRGKLAVLARSGPARWLPHSRIKLSNLLSSIATSGAPGTC